MVLSFLSHNTKFLGDNTKIPCIFFPKTYTCHVSRNLGESILSFINKMVNWSWVFVTEKFNELGDHEIAMT